MALTIDDPELDKLQGIRCPNALSDNSCAIYEQRPQACRGFNCGWRKLEWIQQSMRPDVSEVLVWLQPEHSTTGQPQPDGVVFMLLRESALEAAGLAESVAATIRRGAITYLHILGPPGYTAAIARIDEVLAEAAVSRDNTAILDVLREAWAVAAAGDFVPIVTDSFGRNVAGGCERDREDT